METKLLPCPFCGGEAELDEYCGRYVVFCKSEKCSWRDTEAEAIEAWNTRAERTCKVRGEWRAISQTQEARDRVCECGHEFGVDRRDHFPFELERLCEMPNFCPNCGAKVVGE